MPFTLFSQGHFSALAAGGGWLALIAGFYIAGLALAFTPCCLPLLPIIGGLIVRQQPSPSTLKALGLSVCYVLGMAFTYTLAGAVFSSVGANLQALFQAPPVLWLFSLLFLALALSMLDVFTFQMPTSLQSKFSALSARQNATSFSGIALMGALSALIVTACVAPALVGALTVASRAGTALRGATALFSLGIGMGTPLIVFGASAGRLRPKAGPWMLIVKRLYGAVFIGVSVYLLGKVLPAGVAHLLWCLPAFVATGVLLVGAPRSASRGWPALLLSTGCLLVGIYFLLPQALLCSSHTCRPDNDRSLPIRFRPVRSLSELRAAVRHAADENKPTVLDFWANWCTSCKEMDATTFSNAQVNETLSQAVLLRVDLTHYTKEDRRILKKFDVYGPPTLIFFDRNGRELTHRSIVGYLPAASFEAKVRSALSLNSH